MLHIIIWATTIAEKSSTAAATTHFHAVLNQVVRHTTTYPHIASYQLVGFNFLFIIFPYKNLMIFLCVAAGVVAVALLCADHTVLRVSVCGCERERVSECLFVYGFPRMFT